MCVFVCMRALIHGCSIVYLMCMIVLYVVNTVSMSGSILNFCVEKLFCMYVYTSGGNRL